MKHSRKSWFAFGIAIGLILLWASVVGTILYIIVHFISKYW